jgi:hypothetical protein
MEGTQVTRCKHSAVVLAAVVRQFAPSRLERQLLARVFELVCQDSRHVSPPPFVEEMGRLSSVPDMHGDDWLLAGVAKKGV